MRRGKRLVSSLLDLSDLSRRDDRTEPGVLTPGTDKRRIRPGTMADRQGGFVMWIIPGLKPRAESFYPFGISSLSTGAVA
jgi:hypothetical protein